MSLNFSSKKSLLAIALGLSLTVQGAENRVVVKHLANEQNIILLDSLKKFLLLPVQENAPEGKVNIIVNNEFQLEQNINIRLAREKVDYYVPLDLSAYQGKSVSVDVTGMPASSLCWKEIKLSDTFDSSNRETYRPVYHHTPVYGWMNDPNGMFYKDGVYHLYFQYNPYGSMWGNMTWGHSTSTDLTHWTYEGTAIVPDAWGAIFSGSCVVDKDNTAGFGKGAVVAFYTSAKSTPWGDIQSQSMAYSLDNGKTFIKYEHNPILTSTERDFRDPKVWEDNGTYHMLVGCRSEEIPGQVVLFSSKDLKEWKFETILAENSTGEIGVMWECPDFFPLGDKHVLICSPQHMRAKGYEFHNGHNSLYFTGDYDSEKHTFEKDAPVSLDYGLDFYAPQTTLLPDGRRVMIAWMKSWDSCVIKEKQRWQGMMTLPRELEYRDGKIWQKPVREIENYRKNRCCYENVKVGESLSLEGVRGRMIDLTVELQNADGIMDGSRNSGNPNQEALDVYNEFRIELARNEEYTTVFTYDRKRQILEIDRTWSGVQRDVVCTRKLQITDDRQNLKLRFILDRSSIELFINDGSKTATTVIPTPVEADEILFHSDGNAVIQVEKYDIVL